MSRTATEGADFWSRRKARVAAEEAAEDRAAAARDADAREAALADKSDAEICEELGLPDPDTMQPGDDFRAFMQKAVPERLRRRALRRLWLSNPALANLDGMLDYGEDFTDSACVIEGMQTAYQVGKGMLAHVQEMARQAEAEAAAEAGDIADGDGDAVSASVALTDAGDVPHDREPEAAPEPEPEPRATATTDAGGDEAPLPPRRRMRFAFADSAGEQA